MRLRGRGKLELDGGRGGRRIPTEGWLVIVQSCWPCEAVFETEVARRYRTKWSIDNAVDDRRGAAPDRRKAGKKREAVVVGTTALMISRRRTVTRVMKPQQLREVVVPYSQASLCVRLRVWIIRPIIKPASLCSSNPYASSMCCHKILLRSTLPNSWCANSV